MERQRRRGENKIRVERESAPWSLVDVRTRSTHCSLGGEEERSPVKRGEGKRAVGLPGRPFSSASKRADNDSAWRDPQNGRSYLEPRPRWIRVDETDRNRPELCTKQSTTNARGGLSATES